MGVKLTRWQINQFHIVLTLNLVTLNFVAAVILLQIVMVGPGTHLVKNQESQCTEPMSPSKKTSEIENA